MATPQENAETVRELIQRVLNEGDIGFAEKTLSESYVERSPMPGGTDTNGFMPGTPATGKPFSMGAIDVFTFDDEGMNTEHYGVYDIMGTMGQLGLLPAPPQ